MLRVFIGYDPREAIAYHVCCNSIIRHATVPVALSPLALNMFSNFYTESHGDGSNAFIYSRFLVPYLCNFSGPALFIDGDMVVKDDIAKVFQLNDPSKDVLVVKHDYKTKFPVKYLGNSNEDYPRKNWSSVMLFNCGNYPNRKLLPEFVKQQTGEYLHRFQWTTDDRIGSLPKEWNWLCGEYEENDQAKLLHYTIGVPAFSSYGAINQARDWWLEFNRSTDPID